MGKSQKIIPLNWAKKRVLKRFVEGVVVEGRGREEEGVMSSEVGTIGKCTIMNSSNKGGRLKMKTGG